MSDTADILCIYLQNVWKNYVLVDSLLESQKDLYNILFVQKSLWNFILFAPFTTSFSSQEVIGTPIHPEWTQMVQFPQDSEQTPRVMCFIHSRLFKLCFALRRDIVDHRDIWLLSFFNKSRCQILINVYSDDLHTVVNILIREALNISNLLYIGGDFNIKDTE